MYLTGVSRGFLLEVSNGQHTEFLSNVAYLKLGALILTRTRRTSARTDHGRMRTIAAYLGLCRLYTLRRANCTSSMRGGRQPLCENRLEVYHNTPPFLFGRSGGRGLVRSRERVDPGRGSRGGTSDPCDGHFHRFYEQQSEVAAHQSQEHSRASISGGEHRE